jgi:hypothetical protein
MHVTTGLLSGFVIAYVENLAMLSSVIIVLPTTGKHHTTVSQTHYSRVVACKTIFFFFACRDTAMYVWKLFLIVLCHVAV